MSIEFNQPSEPVSEYHRFVKPADMDGHLLLILSVDGKREVFDQFKGGNVLTVEITVVDLDGDKVARKVRFQQAGIVNRLQPGETNVLVRLGKVKTKKGYVAWTLKQHEPEDAAKAVAWIEAAAEKPTVKTVRVEVTDITPDVDAWVAPPEPENNWPF